MNMYAYCKNNPLNFIDPSGNEAISFYDSGASDGLEQIEMADDFISFDYAHGADANMNPLEYVLWVLEKAENEWDIYVTDIYFFGHGSAGGAAIGSWTLSAGAPIADQFWRDLGEAAPDATINIRSCQAAVEDDYGIVIIEEIARLSGLTVTGADGDIWDTVPWWLDNSSTWTWRHTGRWEGTGPDYELKYGYGFHRATVQEDGTVKTELYWKNTLRYVETSDFTGYWYNPYGPQPY